MSSARARQGCRFRGRQSVGNGRQRVRVRDHHLGIASITGNSGNRLILAVHEVAFPARRAAAAIAGEETNAHALADFPEGHALSNGIDLANDFVAWNAGVLNPRSKPLDGEDIGMTDTASLNANPYFPRRWCLQFAVSTTSRVPGLLTCTAR